MQISKVRLKQRAVVIEYSSEKESHALTSRDNPLPSFVTAVENLKAIALGILHLPAEYAEKMKTTGLTLVDKQETQLVTIVAQKELPECHSPFNIATPLRFMAHPETEGSYSPPLTEKEVAAVQEVIDEAKKYVAGERAQGQLPLGKDEDADDDTEDGKQEPQAGDVLDFKAKSTPPAPTHAHAPAVVNPPKRRGKAAAAAAQ